MKHIVVIYHGRCLDGFTAAWTAWKKMGNRADYLPVDPEVLPEKELKNKEIYIVDNSYPGSVLRKMKRENKSVVVIDHHISAKPHVVYATQAVFDTAHSGCVLAWNFFHPQKPLPQLCRFVEDVDLWRFQIKNSKAITAALEIGGQSFKRWSNIARDLESSDRVRKYVGRGSIVLEHQQEIVKNLADQADLVSFEGEKTLAVNSPIFSSEIGAELVNRLPPIGLVWREQNGRMCVSLRSNGKVDVAQIAAKFGGGGHRAASGFCLPRNTKTPWKYIGPARKKIWRKNKK